MRAGFLGVRESSPPDYACPLTEEQFPPPPILPSKQEASNQCRINASPLCTTLAQH